MFMTINGQSTNKLMSFYDDWMDDISRSDEGHECLDCFQKRAGDLVEQLMSIKDVSRKNSDISARLQVFQTVIYNLRNIVESGILTVNDMAYYNTSAPSEYNNNILLFNKNFFFILRHSSANL